MDQLQEALFLNKELKKINELLLKELERLRSKIIIDDYSNYTPKERKSLSVSKIRTILDDFYAQNKERVDARLQEFCGFEEKFKKIPVTPINDDSIEPSWINEWLPGGDCISLYAQVALKNPRYFVECGSGNSTKFVRRAIVDNNLRTRIISIDPFPRANIDPICDEQHKVPLENMDLNFFTQLTNEDIFFIDNSHRSFQNSDVTVFFTEILPILPAGLLCGVHDILLPNDYPERWSARYYNEQYLLCCCLLGGNDLVSIELPMAYLACYTSSLNVISEMLCRHPTLSSVQSGGAAFWMIKN